MKMNKYFILIGLVILALIGWIVFVFFKPNPGKTDNAVITLGESQKFSKEEIQAAADCILKEFKNFKGCDLKKLWYDEKCSDEYVDGYMSAGNGSINGISKENVVVFLSDFHTDSTYREAGFTSDSDYDNWNWILIRDSKTSEWRVDDFGY